MRTNIVLAGSSGVIGSFLFKELSKNKELNVTGIGAEKLEINNYSKIDLTNFDNTNNVISKITKPDVLIFLVALAHEKGKNKEIDTFRLINFTTLVNLMEVLKKQNKLPSKIIFTSTISVYGEKYHTSEYSEDSAKTPKSPYAVTKLEAEEYLLKNYHNISFILRFTPVYSEKFKLNIERRTQIKNFFYKICNGKNKLSLLSIKNILLVIEEIINDKIPAGIYNISDEKEYTFEDLLKIQNPNKVITIPKSFISMIYYLNKIIRINFIEENSIKLLTDNIYPSTKIQKYIKLKDNLYTTLKS
jgi:nucleoside-diphosphate-sugar epimerase